MKKTIYYLKYYLQDRAEFLILMTKISTQVMTDKTYFSCGGGHHICLSFNIKGHSLI